MAEPRGRDPRPVSAQEAAEALRRVGTAVRSGLSQIRPSRPWSGERRQREEDDRKGQDDDDQR